MGTVRLIFAFLFLIYVQETASSKPKHTVKVSIYYESALPISVNLFTAQLHPTFQKLGEFLTLDLIPYSKADKAITVNGSWIYECSRNSHECLLNKLEICGFTKTDSQSAQLDYLLCLESQTSVKNYKKLNNQCALLLNVNEDELWNCANGPEGEQLFAEIYKKTNNQKITDLPRIVFNDYYDSALEDEAFADFYKTVCLLMSNKPKECRTHETGLLHQNDEMLKITVYYEALCPDSVRFITKQLYPTYSKIGNFLIIDLVPYGKATQVKKNGKWVFECQHGPEECQANKQQACSLQMYSNQTEIVTFISCVMSYYDPGDRNAVEKCASKSGFFGKAILNCSESVKGDEYLAKYGDRTHSATPRISFIPTIVFNDVYDAKIQFSSLSNLLETACKELFYKPTGCSNVQHFYLLSIWSPQRRQMLYTLSQPGGHPHTWKRLIESILTLLSTFQEHLNKGLQNSPYPQDQKSINEPTLEMLSQSYFEFNEIYANMRPMDLNPLVETAQIIEVESKKWAFSELTDYFKDTITLKFGEFVSYVQNLPSYKYLFDDLTEAQIQECFRSGQTIVWVVQGLANIIVKSLNEDPYGVIQRDLPVVLSNLVELKTTLDKLSKGSGPIKKGSNGDDFSRKMSDNVNNATRRSLTSICRTFSDYLEDIPVDREVRVELLAFA
ncbi:hypothetical protein RN001_006945 [Aquatica leii]|uniref:Gamma-interferon-inducible lysosomal thiol reductase n=1 Tax=Aquatica leii TaxID=1421715 RepID=A0AAN7PLM4_9COLE|nr:hypothetical protein RN001_006945 [Aquatica leii]